MDVVVLLVAIAIPVVALFLAPTLIGLFIGQQIQASRERAGRRATELSLQRASALHAAGFQPDKRFFGGEGGLAFDTGRKLVFISSPVARGQEQGRIYPIGAVLKWRKSSWTNARNVETHFMDLTVNDVDHPTWRVGFYRDEQTAREAGAMFELLWARPEPVGARQ